MTKYAKKLARQIANGYLKDDNYNYAFDLGILISERIEYYSDRWSNNGVQFEVVRILLKECEKRWMKEAKTRRLPV